MKTWIVVVNRIEAKIFECDRKNKSDLHFITKLENPRGRLKAQDIDADKPGIFAVVTSHGSGMERPQSPTDRVAQMFAKRVVQYLELARQQTVENFIIIADPSFLGRLRANYSRELRDLISKEISKDLGYVTEAELKDRLAQEPQPSLGF